MMQSLVNDAEQGGWLPKWPTANLYTGVQGGDAADPMIADAYAFGARDFDVKTALQYMLKGANDTSSALGQGVYAPRIGYVFDPAAYGDYAQLGYVPSGDADNPTPAGTSLTEEFALADFSTAQIAQAAGDGADQAEFLHRAQNWQNVFDPGSSYVQPRGVGAVPPPANPAAQQDGFEEGNAAQYAWMIPQNFAGLFTAMGGESAAAAKLDTLFTQLNAGSALPYEWMGNEPDLGTPWAYDYLGQPWKTQRTVRDIITQLYGPTPGGEPGNDDLGAMSSWYVWAALGMYPATPGTDTLVLGSPLFPHSIVHLANGKAITIDAPNAAPGTAYVQALQKNGQDWPKNYLTGSQYNNGATLIYDLATTPNISRGTGPSAPPPSYRSGEASATGFTSPWGGIAIPVGNTADVQVGAQSQVNQPQTLTWTATTPAGIQITPSSGTLTVKPGQQASQPATVSVARGTPLGTVPIHITYTGPDGRQVTSTDLQVRVDFQCSDDLAWNPSGAAYPAAFDSSHQAPYPPSRATDCNVSTYWVAGAGPTPQNPQVLGVDFGAPVTVGSVLMFPRTANGGYGPKTYSIQISNDNQTWTTVADVSNAPNNTVTTTFPPATARYLRLLITGTLHAGTVQIAELFPMAP